MHASYTNTGLQDVDIHIHHHIADLVSTKINFLISDDLRKLHNKYHITLGANEVTCCPTWLMFVFNDNIVKIRVFL